MQDFNTMRKSISVFCCALVVVSLLFSGCSSINKTQKTAVLGSAAGGAIGAIIGKRAGNPAVGATIGAVIGASTGAYIGKRLDNFTGNRLTKTSPLYVVNGKVFLGKEAEDLLSSIQSETIESVVILKSKEAVALYGNKGANGAVLIHVKEI